MIMAPKRGKGEHGGSEESGAGGGAEWNKHWESALNATALQEDCWHVCVSLVVCDSVYEEVCMRALCQAVQQPLRRLFSLLSWENLQQKVNELGNPRTRTIKELPTFYEVTEVSRTVLDSGDEISVDLLAKLVKFQMLDIKHSDIQRRPETQRQEQETVSESLVRGKSAKGAKGKTETLPLRKDTKLKRRGDNCNTSSYIDDEPDEGPQHYILMTGFHQPSLIRALDSVGVHISSIIRLKSDRSQIPCVVQADRETDTSEHEFSTGELDLQQELNGFWDQLDGVLTSANFQSKLSDVALLDYKVDQNLLRRDLTKAKEMEEMGLAVFEGVACLLYDSLDWRRQYEHYLSRMRLVNVPNIITPVLSGEMKSEESSDVDLRLYSDLLDRIPQQCISVPLVLHCLIEQVVSSEQEVCSEGEESNTNSDLEHDLISYMMQSVRDLPRDEQENSVVDSLDVVNAEVCMMKKNYLFTLLYKQLNTNNFDTARTHQFLQYCSTDSLSCANVQRLLQLSMFESMPLTALDGSKSHTVTALPWDDPMTFTHNSHDLNTIQGGKVECDEQQENKISIKDLEKFRFRHYTHWNFTEHHNADVFPQVLQTASESYTCVDSFHSSQLNVMYVICHNPMSPARSSSGSWKASVHTDVSFRSYLENVAEFLRDWSIAEEERLHKQQQETEDSTLKGVSVMSPVPEKFEVFLRQDSLKAWKLEQDRQKDEELMKKTKKEKGKSSGQGADQERKMSQEDECHMPSFSTEQTKNKNEMNDMGDSGGAHTHIENQPGFTGFKMDGMLVQVKGESQCIYPSDGGQISVERVQYLQGSTWLKVCVTKNKHCFYTHIIEPERENTHDQPLKFGSFCALLSNGLRLAYSHKCQQEGPEASPFQLHVCLPTGLQINFSFQQAAYGQAVLVHQTLPFSRAILSNTHTEFSRTITCNGAVIKHLRDGSTMILFADGTVSVSPDSGPVYVTLPTSAGQDEDPEQRQTGSTATKVKSSSGVGVEEEKPKAGVELKEQVKMRCGSWCTTTPSGVRIRTIRGEQVEEKPVLAFYSTDPQTPSLVMVMTRDDGVLCVMEKDRSVVEHADGTRITFSCQQRETLSQQHIDQEPVSAHSSGGSKNEGSVSTIKVENTGFATVRMRCEEKSGEVLFSDGTTISATAHGSYRVCLSDGGCLSIREDGAAEYNSTGPEVDQCVRYVMSHSAGLVCELTDTGGNHYQVTSEGSVSITHAHIDTERGTQHNTTPETHTPRLFMMYADGSALEFLSSHTVDEILQKENTQASVAVIREPAPHTPDAFEITILKPFSDLSSYWLSPKHLDDIIPANFKIRKWNALPVSEVKTRSSPFRSSLGQGLEVKEGAMPGSEPTPPVLQNSCTLLLRRITEHIPFTQQQYQHVQHKLLLYINDLLQQKKLKDEMSPRDPKAVEEKLHRSDLHCLPSPVGSAPGSSPQSMFSLYSQTLGVFHLLPLNQHSDQQETHCTKPKQSSAWLEKLQQHRSNVQEQRKHLYALRNHIIPPYFHSEHQETAHSLQQELEVKSGSHVLPSFPKRRNIKFKNLFQH